MAANKNLTNASGIKVTPRQVDFVTRFQLNWEHLREIMGIMRPIRKEPGVVLKSKKVSLVLEDGNVAEGDLIPNSKATIVETPYDEMKIEKFKKEVSAEAIKEHGYDVAVADTDTEFLFQLQTNVTNRFYQYLNKGELTSKEKTWQMALAMAQGRVIDKFKEMHRTATGIVAFVNVLDVYEYLGTANITIQNKFGFQYIKDFMGYDTVFLLSVGEIQRGRVIATAKDNINLYYVNPGMSDFARAGLNYYTRGDTPLIGFATQGDYDRATSNSYAIMGLTLFAEYIDAIAVIDVEAGNPKMGELTVNNAPGTEGHVTLEVSPAKAANGNKYKYKIAKAGTPVEYGDNVRMWPAWDGKSEIAATSTDVITLVETNGAYQAIKSGETTVE